MKHALLISEIEEADCLINALNELRNRSYIISEAVKFESGLNFLSIRNNINKFDLIIINASERRLEALEFCKYLSNFKLEKIRILVFLPGASLHEASKFGFFGAFTEDENSIEKFILNLEKEKSTKNKTKNLICISSLTNSLDSSSVFLSLAKLLGSKEQKTLLSETSLYQTVRQLLNIQDFKTLLESSIVPYSMFDINWLKTYLEPTQLGENSLYLSLFKNPSFKLSPALDQIKLDNALNLAIEKFDHCLIDIASDFSSEINIQLLKRTKYLFIVLENRPNIHEDYKRLKSFLENEYRLLCFGIISSSNAQIKKYREITKQEWLEKLEEEPLLVSDLDFNLALFLKNQKSKFNSAEVLANEMLHKMNLDFGTEKRIENKWFSLTQR
jgi:hypothetical protein